MKYFFLKKINNDIVIFKSESHTYFFFRSNKGNEKSLKEPQMF